MELNEAVARKVLETVDAGLVNGLGTPKPGQMCVEAAVCYALGIAHSDNPPCVGSAVRSFKIALNDSRWSSNAARAKGLRRVAIAQLGSDGIDQAAFVAYVVEQTIRRIVPIALRAAAKLATKEKHKDALEVAAKRCESEGTRDAAYAAANAAAYAAAYAAANAANAAANAANAAAYAAADAAAYAANAAANARDSVLSLSAGIAVEALIELGATGAQWLSLCEER